MFGKLKISSAWEMRFSHVSITMWFEEKAWAETLIELRLLEKLNEEMWLFHKIFKSNKNTVPITYYMFLKIVNELIESVLSPITILCKRTNIRNVQGKNRANKQFTLRIKEFWNHTQLFGLLLSPLVYLFSVHFNVNFHSGLSCCLFFTKIKCEHMLSHTFAHASTK